MTDLILLSQRLLPKTVKQQYLSRSWQVWLCNIQRIGYVYLGTLGIGALGATVAGLVLTYSTPMTLFVILAGFAATAVVLGMYLIIHLDGNPEQ